MLPLEHLFENFDLAKEALSHWDHEEEGLEEALGQFRISSNAVYPFPWQGERCYLRLAPLGEKAFPRNPSGWPSCGKSWTGPSNPGRRP